MKRTLKGMDAYSKILGRELPEKTKTYTPIAHSNVINKVRSEITNAGYVITGEEYRCSKDGDIAIGTFKLKYKEDDDIELSANFLNSYNKQYAFRFALGGLVKVCSNGMVLNNNKFGSYKRVHKGEADILAEGKIKEFIDDSSEYWDTLVQHKDSMKDLVLSKEKTHDILGRLFFDKEILNTMQLNIVKREMEKPSFDYKVADPSNAWALYNHITLALKESHPATWIQDQTSVHEVFSHLLSFGSKVDVTSSEEITEIPEGDSISDMDDSEVEAITAE